MREIKFRQYIKGIWHFWGFLENGVFIGPANNTSSEEQQEESQQFTGLKDKNGKEIYEGDLLQFNKPNYDKRPFKVEYQIDYLDGDGYKHTGYDCDSWDEAEVIGNIFENPNLLTK